MKTVKLLARITEDGYLLYATTDLANGWRDGFWQGVEMEGGDTPETVELFDVPPDLARKLTAQGTADQEFSDGYEAGSAAIPYL